MEQKEGVCVKRPSLDNLSVVSHFSEIETAETPGGESVGQQSLGEDSCLSAYSNISQCKFLSGKTEKDEYIDKCLEQIEMELEDEQKDCGIWRLRPECLQQCANVKIFVLFMCLLLTVSGTLSTGYLNSVITTIEKRFEIGSVVSGSIAASYELGSLIAVIFISYLGGRRNIPKWIGVGIMVMGFGALLFALPHLIAEKYTVHQRIINDTTENICKSSRLQQDQEICIDENSGSWGYVLILIVAQVLIGTGGSPILTLGTTFIDDHVAKEKTPVYLAFIYATGALGPVLGYALGALLLQFYVDMFSYDVNLYPGHPRWIGVWWGGFIICGFLLLALAVPFLMFPRVLVKETRKLLETKAKEELLTHEERDAITVEYGKTIKDIPKSVLRLLKNTTYLVTCLGICCEISIVSGFVVFLPKYIETQFGTSKSVANLFTGGIGIPGAVFGILAGGFILKRFQLHPKGAIQLTLILDGLALVGCAIFFFLGCDNLKIAGATFPYFNSTGYNMLEANLTSTCNMDCECSPNDLEPICGINGITYFSPCHAGCTRFYNTYTDPDENMKNFSGCSCIMNPHSLASEVIMSPLATSGPCKSRCQSLLPFLIVLVVVTFCVAGTQMPLVMVTLRSVNAEERCFALGMQLVILRLFGYIPAPIMFGNTIDTSCLLWKQKCAGSGQCLVYDIVDFRYHYVGISAGLKVMSMIFFFIVWLQIYRKNKRDAEITITVGDVMTSMTSINKLDLDYDQRHYSPKISPVPSPVHRRSRDYLPSIYNCQDLKESSL